MIIKPVKKQVKPKYPDKYEIELDKALLYYRPKRWLSKPIMGLSLSALIGLSGCELFDDIFGTGATGGLPPKPDYIYISDNDALRIIAEELENAGYSLEAGRHNGDFEFDAQITNGADTMDLEYVSIEDCNNIKYPGLSYESSYNPLLIANELKLAHTEAAVFHDPLAWDNPEEKLRSQILDFIQWLQSIDLAK